MNDLKPPTLESWSHINPELYAPNPRALNPEVLNPNARSLHESSEVSEEEIPGSEALSALESSCSRVEVFCCAMIWWGFIGVCLWGLHKGVACV